MSKKVLAIVMAVILSFSILAVPTLACFDNSGKGINAENYVNQLLDDVIHKALKVFNLVWPGYDKKWSSQDDYSTSDFYAGASLLEGLDIMNGEYFLAGSLEPFAGRVPTTIHDDQRVRVYAISDGVSGIAIQAVVDGFGLSRGDVQEIRSRVEKA